MNDAELFASLRAQGYLDVRRIRDGPVIGVCPMWSTFGLMVGCDDGSYQSRYCYEDAADVAIAFRQWDGTGDPPGPWIKHKGAGRADRLGPGALGDAGLL